MADRFILTVSAEQRAKLATIRKALDAKSDAEAVRKLIDGWEPKPAEPTLSPELIKLAVAEGARLAMKPLPVLGMATDSEERAARERKVAAAEKRARAVRLQINPRGYALDGTPIY